MDNALSPDWTLIRSFLAVAQHGSLSGAARQLNMSQPTLGRHIKALERTLDTTLFTRHPQGLALSPSGSKLLPYAGSMEENARKMELIAGGEDAGLAGTVRVTASRYVSQFLLPDMLAGLRQDHPEMQIELVPSDTSENLLFREADIAVRMYRPRQLETIGKHLGDLRLGFYGANTYLNRRGRPETLDDIKDHDLVGYDRDDRIIRGMREQGWAVSRNDFAVRCDDQLTYWELVRAGCGLGIAQCVVADADPSVDQVLKDMPMPSLPVWLTAHETMRHTPRIDRTWSALVEHLGALTG